MSQAEEQISGKRVDYGFYLNGFIKFYLEAKPLKTDKMHDDEYAQQAIRYSWNKGVTWAILSNFETTIVFNALSPDKSLFSKKYLRDLRARSTRADSNQLWLLSKESFGQSLIDKEAEQHGKKAQKVSVTESLSKDMNECRGLLTKAFEIWNTGVDSHLIDEGSRSWIDRMVFIRVAEDRKIEPPTLRPMLHQWLADRTAGKNEGSLYQAMIGKFRELDKIYNSNLFSEHPFEKWEEYNDATKEVIEILYGRDTYFEYDFSIIPADVLGSVYENYLGYRLQKSKEKKKDGTSAEGSQNLRKRKEQGIYYTPKFVVEYIVKNTLGPVLDSCRDHCRSARSENT